jgi:hypothetical protein
VMNTIDSRASDGYASDSRPVQYPPADPIFNSPYDSDGSDGRWVSCWPSQAWCLSFFRTNKCDENPSNVCLFVSAYHCLSPFLKSNPCNLQHCF